MTVNDKMVPLIRVISKTKAIDLPLIENLKRKRKNLFGNAKQLWNKNKHFNELSRKVRKMKTESTKKRIKKILLDEGPQGLWKAYKLAEDKP